MFDALLIILLSIIPGALYAFIIWLTMPFNSFSLRTSYSYIILGTFSVTIVGLLHSFLPFLYTDAISLLTRSTMGDIQFMHGYSFYQIAITEEFSKWLVFYLTCILRNVSNDDSNKDSPIATMVYCAMISLGFAILENVQYGKNYGTNVVFSRLFSAVLMHIEVGLIMGYWIAMSKIDNSLFTRSITSVLFKKNRKLKTVILTFIGISAAVFVHGLYDFNLFIFSEYGLPLMYTILGLGAFISYIGANHLISLTKK